jgi:sugar/nucleoside kinase (ribokinase family)
MSDRSAIARQAAAGIRQFAPHAPHVSVMLGFDGFVDSIIHVVDKRHSEDRFDRIPTIENFGQKILAAAGQSSNYELVTTQQKLGGNGPIMANAIASASVRVTYIGAVGYPALHPVFHELGDRAEVMGIADAGTTDALEFSDGKIMLGKYNHLLAVNDQNVRDMVGDDCFKQIIARSQLIAMVNWVMMAGTENIWRYLANEVLPNIPPQIAGRRRIIFLDLCDPQKRTTDDIRHALHTAASLQQHADVILGLNLSESSQIAAVLNISVPADAEAAIESTALAIREKLNLYCVVIHPRRGAAAARLTPAAVQSASFAGPFVAEPKLSTGAGDNFNAGFCLGELANLPLDQCLCTGTATSGFYVRNAYSPSLQDLADFCDKLPAPQACA